MNEQQFWDTIESSIDDDPSTQLDRLQAQLNELPAEHILVFQSHYDQRMQQAYSWDLWGAAYVIKGGCSDDGFHYFRDWLISRGLGVYQSAMANPDSLVDIAECGDDCEFEEFGYVAMQAWTRKTSQSMDDFYSHSSSIILSDPQGEAWNEDSEELAARYPQLSAKFDAYWASQ